MGGVSSAAGCCDGERPDRFLSKDCMNGVNSTEISVLPRKSLTGKVNTPLVYCMLLGSYCVPPVQTGLVPLDLLARRAMRKTKIARPSNVKRNTDGRWAEYRCPCGPT